MRKCTSCGEPLKTTDSFCPKCGALNPKSTTGEKEYDIPQGPSWSQLEKEHKRKRRIIILAIIIGIIAFLIFSCNQNIKQQELEERTKPLNWSTTGLCAMLPTPESEYGYIMINTSSTLDVDVYQCSEEAFSNYKQECKNMGYTYEVMSEESNEYTAFNQEGYRLELYFYSYSEEISIKLSAPVVFTEMEWTGSEIREMLPVPPTKKVYIERESSTYLSAYLYVDSVEQYMNYVNSCISAGFNKDYYINENYFSGNNAHDDDLTLNYLGNHTAELRLYVRAE